jgi:hypothetical protein
MYASVQSFEFLELAEDFSFLDRKPPPVPMNKKMIDGWVPAIFMEKGSSSSSDTIRATAQEP